LTNHRRLDTLAGAEEVDGFLREVAGALGGDQDQGAAAIGHQAALQQPERVGDHPRVQHIIDRDRRLEGGARLLRRPFALHDRDHRQLLVRQPIGLHVAQNRDREQSQRAHWHIGLLEPAGELVGATTLWVRPTPERPVSPWVISTVSRRPEAIAAAAWRTWIMNDPRAAAPGGPSWGPRPQCRRPISG
jgi:hypothetical protein